MGEILKVFLEQKGWLAPGPYAALFQRWKEIAGEPLGDHCRLSDIEAGTLIVEVDHPGWAQLVGLKKKALLEAARRISPDSRITEVRCRLSRGR